MSAFLFVALDNLLSNREGTIKTAGRIADQEGNFGFKINLDYILAYGIIEALESVRALGRPIFADIKMWNGARTMASIAEELVGQGVAYFNVYALAGELLPKAIEATKGSATKVLGLTVLTHYSESYCQRHFRRSLGQTVRFLAKTALQAGCHGIIVPGTTLDEVANLKAIKVVPGVRPSWYQDLSHEQEIEPKTAVEKGADILVCGSPIMKAKDPVTALRKILEEIQ